MQDYWLANKMKAEMFEKFNLADANNDELLDQSEYLDFIAALNADRKARGFFVDERQEFILRSYQWLNKFSPEVEGVSIRDYKKGMSL